MNPHWSQNAFIYHIYPLGMCGAPRRNDFSSAPQPRLLQILGWLDGIQALGCETLLLGPLFESSSHGYDTVDYWHVDRRLGADVDLLRLSEEIHRRGMRLLLDGVLNHVGRDFWAFTDLRARREASDYRDWFAGVDFSRPGTRGDGFSYLDWAGHDDLVKLNHASQAVREHLFGAVQGWIERFSIDGLRLDAADVIDTAFLAELTRFTRSLRPDFWLLGEMVHGDYRRLTGTAGLDAVTNYEVYKGLWSSFNDRNFFEIAYALNRQSGEAGLYASMQLYNFADNHDVDRLASSLRDPAHLPLAYGLLLTMPGVPSLYNGSEWGWQGRRTPHSDWELRPACQPGSQPMPHPELPGFIARLAALRRAHPALRLGGYLQMHVASEQIVYLRTHPAGDVLVALNAAREPAHLSIPSADSWDELPAGQRLMPRGGRLALDLPPLSLRALRRV